MFIILLKCVEDSESKNLWSEILVFFIEKKKNSNGVMLKWKELKKIPIYSWFFQKETSRKNFWMKKNWKIYWKNNNVKNDILDSCKDAKIIKVARK